jgi:hypothetical protein
MRFPIRPGKVSCAGVVAILMVLPNSIWKGPDAKGSVARTKIQQVHKVEKRKSLPARAPVKSRAAAKIHTTPR